MSPHRYYFCRIPEFQSLGTVVGQNVSGLVEAMRDAQVRAEAAPYEGLRPPNAFV
jgi:hypothetical protein